MHWMRYQNYSIYLHLHTTCQNRPVPVRPAWAQVFNPCTVYAWLCRCILWERTTRGTHTGQTPSRAARSHTWTAAAGLSAPPPSRRRIGLQKFSWSRALPPHSTR